MRQWLSRVVARLAVRKDRLPLHHRLRVERFLQRLEDKHPHRWRKRPRSSPRRVRVLSPLLQPMNVARDVILAQAEDGTLHCSAFAVSFKPVSTLYKWLVSRPALSRLHALRGGGTIPPSAAAPGQEEGPSDAGDGPANTLAASILSSIGLSPNPPPTPSSASSAASRPALRGSTENVVETSSPVVPSPTDDSSLSQPQPPPTHPHRREGVEVYVRGQLVPGLEMVVDEKGACVFVSTGTTHPSPTSLQTLAAGGLLEPGINPVEFVYCNPYGDVSVQASFHLWGVHDRLVVSDIDGTVTKSDVRGYVHSVHLGK